MKAYWGWRYRTMHYLTSALDGGEWSASRPGRFTPRERAPGVHWIGGWVGPRAVLDAVVKRKIPTPRRESNPRTPIVQPVAQLCTDWGIMALRLLLCNTLIPHLLHPSYVQVFSFMFSFPYTSYHGLPSSHYKYLQNSRKSLSESQSKFTFIKHETNVKCYQWQIRFCFILF
jgi:hypothetical protein